MISLLYYFICWISGFGDAFYSEANYSNLLFQTDFEQFNNHQTQSFPKSKKHPKSHRDSKSAENIFEGCTNLIEVHSSVAVLKRLIFMDLKDCIRLRSLPSRIETESLEILIISGCSNVKVILDNVENMQKFFFFFFFFFEVIDRNIFEGRKQYTK